MCKYHDDVVKFIFLAMSYGKLAQEVVPSYRSGVGLKFSVCYTQQRFVVVHQRVALDEAVQNTVNTHLKRRKSFGLYALCAAERRADSDGQRRLGPHRSKCSSFFLSI